MSEFTITGPGEYRTRGGMKATITKDWEKQFSFRFDGTIARDRSIEKESWRENGQVLGDVERADDIIGPWVEPEDESPAIDAGTPEDFPAGITASDEYRAAQSAENLRVSNALANAVGDYGSVAVPSALAEQREVDEARESAEALSAALRIMLDASPEPGSVEFRDAVLVARAVLEVHGQ